MEAQGSCWSARETYLNKEDCLKLEIEEMELLIGPEDSEGDLRYVLMNASRRGSWIFEISARKRKVGTLLQAKCDGMRVTDRGWRRRRKRGHQGACRMRMTAATVAGPRHVKGSRGECLSFLADSEVAKVSIRELEEQVLSPNESRIIIVRIVRQARNHKKNIK